MIDLIGKPLGRKAYGSIPHLPNSRLGKGDHRVHEGSARICTEKVRDRYDRVIVQEKLDGSNVAVALLKGRLWALGRSGWPAETSPYEQHKLFAQWVWFAVTSGKERCAVCLAALAGKKGEQP